MVAMVERDWIRCRACDELLARVGKQGGVYPLDGVRMILEYPRVSLQCPACKNWRRWQIGKQAA